MKKSLKISMIIVSITLILLIGFMLIQKGYFFIRNYSFYSVDRDSYLYITPEYREIAAPKTNSIISEISNNALKISSPWGNPVNTKISGSATIFTFENNKKIILYERFEGSFLDDLNDSTVNKLQDNPEMKPAGVNKEKYVQLYGKDNMSSNFMFNKAVLSVTPKDIRLSMPRRLRIRNLALLNLKKISEIANESGKIYYYDNENLKGFQYGTTKNPILWVYDKNDAQYQIAILGNDITQVEIDSIISSVKFNS